MKFLALLLSAMALFAFGCIAAPNLAAPDGVPQGCTKEAKACPGGSTVTRNSSLNCEFNPCPSGGNTPPLPPGNASPPIPPIVGNDSDEHGCRGSAGYSWCAEKEKCLRTWEEVCGEAAREGKAREICGNLSYWRVSAKAGTIIAWLDNARADYYFDNGTTLGCAFPPPSGQDARCQEIYSLRAAEKSICIKGAN